MPVVVDVVLVSAALVGAGAPQVARVVVTGLTPGVPMTVTGSAMGAQWPVRGGALVPSQTQVALTDVRAPLNLAVTYTVTSGGQSATSAPITIPYTGRYAFQSLDGRTAVPFVGVGNGSPRALQLRSVSFDVPGRSSSPSRWDVAAGVSGAFDVLMTPSASAAFMRLMATGAPMLVLRTDGALYDFAPTEILQLTTATSSTLGGDTVDRLWSLSYQVVEDPEPSTIVPAVTIADFNAAWAGSTVADFNAAWAGSTIAEFNLTDWTA